MSPLGTTYVTVRKATDVRRLLGSTAGIGAVAASSCRFATSLQFQSYTVGLTVAGVTLFRSAESIAGARNARLAAGGVLLSAASVLLLSIFIVSRFQSKRLKWAMSALFFTTTAVWSPFLMESSMQWEMLLQSPLFILYLCVTFVCGMMVVAYFESGSTTRSADGGSAAITVLAHCIRACGVVCVVLGVSDVHVAAAVVAALIGAEVLGAWASHPSAVMLQNLISTAVSPRRSPPPERPTSPTFHSRDDQMMMSPQQSTGRTRVSGGSGDGDGLTFPTPPSNFLARTTSVDAVFGRRLGSAFRNGWDSLSSPPSSGRSSDPVPPPSSEQGCRTATLPSSAPADGDDGETAAIVRDGFVYNSKTKKNVKIGSATYLKLLKAGFEVDMSMGTISPAGTGGPSSGGSGSLSSMHPRRLSAAMGSPAAAGPTPRATSPSPPIRSASPPPSRRRRG